MSRNNTIIGGYVNPLAFSPVLWVDFADASTVTTSSGLITQVVSKGSGGHVFSQATPGSRPAYISAGLNGLNLARFDGTDDVLRIGTNNLLRNVTGATVYVVCRINSVTANNNGLFAVSNKTGSGARGYIFSVGTTGLAAIGGRTLDADSFADASSAGSVTTGVYRTHVGVFDYANTDAFQYINTGLDGSNLSFHAATTTSNTASFAGFIGSASGGGIQFHLGDICEILVYHSAHNTATRTSITQYLRAKWGI